MGLEAKCIVRVGGASHRGTALLETDELLFRGPARLKIPFASITALDATAGVLRVTHAGGSAAFELGDAAAKWAEKIRSPRSLLDKLGAKLGMVVSVIGDFDADFVRDLERRVSTLSRGDVRKGSDLIFFLADQVAHLTRLSALEPALATGGAIWVVHPKGKGALKDTEIFAAGEALGLTATKVVRFSESHTGEKLVRRKSAGGSRLRGSEERRCSEERALCARNADAADDADCSSALPECRRAATSPDNVFATPSVSELPGIVIPQARRA
jgi:hypothetical protein